MSARHLLHWEPNGMHKLPSDVLLPVGNDRIGCSLCDWVLLNWQLCGVYHLPSRICLFPKLNHRNASGMRRQQIKYRWVDGMHVLPCRICLSLNKCAHTLHARYLLSQRVGHVRNLPFGKVLP